MSNQERAVRNTISQSLMLARLEQSEQMREFFIQMWAQNPALAKQGGSKVQNLMTSLMPHHADSSSLLRGGKAQRGISLIELIMFIVIVSVALTGVMLTVNYNTRHSADPLLRKQALAIAESLMEEVTLMPFTFCDPDDPAVTTAANAAACTTAEVMGPEAGETRYAATPYDNVNDYNAFSMSGLNGIRDITNGVIPVANGYSAAVSITPTAIAAAGTGPAIAAAESLLVKVTVTAPGGAEQVILEGYRTRHSPNSP